MGDIFDQIQAEATASQTPVQKFWNTLKEGNLAKIGSFVFNDLPAAATGSPAAAYRVGDFATNVGRSLVEEPGRIAQEVREAGKAYRAGDYGKLETHLRQAIPLIGPQGEKALRQIERGETAEGLANMLDLIGQFAGPEIASEFGPRVLGATSRGVLRAAEGPTGRGVAAGVTAGGPQVAKGVLKAGAGLALGTHGPLPTIADALLGIKFGESGLRDVASGASAGWDAFKQAKAEALAAEARAAQPPVRPPPPEAASEAYYADQPGGTEYGKPANSAEYYESQGTGEPATPASAPATPASAPASGPPVELLDQIGMELAGKPFAKLPPNAQKIVTELATKFDKGQQGTANPPQPAPPPPEPTPAPEPGPDAIQPGTTVADLIRQELEARRAAAAPAEAPPTVEAQPAAPAPEEAAPETTPAEGSPVPLEAGAEVEQLRKQAAIEARIQGSRTKAADAIAKHLYNAGFKLEAIDAQPPDIQAKFWKNAGAAHRKGYSPSADTIDAIRERLAAMEAPKAPASPDAIYKAAQRLRASGINAATVAKYAPDQLQALGIQPYQIKPLLRAMMVQDVLPPAELPPAVGQ